MTSTSGLTPGALSSTFVGTGLHILLGRLPGMAVDALRQKGSKARPELYPSLVVLQTWVTRRRCLKILQPAADGGSADVEVRAVKSDPNCFALEVALDSLSVRPIRSGNRPPIPPRCSVGGFTMRIAVTCSKKCLNSREELPWSAGAAVAALRRSAMKPRLLGLLFAGMLLIPWEHWRNNPHLQAWWVW